MDADGDQASSSNKNEEVCSDGCQESNINFEYSTETLDMLLEMEDSEQHQFANDEAEDVECDEDEDEDLYNSDNTDCGNGAVNCSTWLQQFATRHGDKMPDSYKIHLPCCIHKNTVYAEMKADLQNLGDDCLSYTQFMRLWRVSMSYICIPKRSRFARCDTCVKLQTSCTETTDPVKKKELKMLREVHLKQQNAERQKYYKHCHKAKSLPNKYLSLIIDGMDQDKTMIPHILTNTKGTNNLWKMKIYVTGVIAHGIGAYAFFDQGQWQHGAAYTTTIICHILAMLTHLPEVLYLQLDNCPGSNKNRFVMGFLAYLVERKVFRKIKLSFLMVGHTHEDIDQMFSRFSVWLNHENAHTLDDLMTGFEKCYSPKPHAIQVTEVLNWPEMLHVNQVQNHSRPHVFRFKTDDMGKAKMTYKKWSTDKVWIECDGGSLLPDTLTSSVKTIPPIMDRIDERVLTDVISIARFYNNKRVELWWLDFIQNLRTTCLEYESTESNIVAELLKKTTTQQENHPHDQDSHILDDQPIPRINIGRRKQVKVDKAAAKSSIEDGIQEGTMALLDCAQYSSEWPQLAKIVEINSNTVTIAWYKGARTSNWTPATRRVKGQRGKTEPFVEDVDVCDIVFCGFALTPAGCLPKLAKDKLDRYER